MATFGNLCTWTLLRARKANILSPIGFNDAHSVQSILNERTVSRVTEYWAHHLGCAADALFASPPHIVTHGAGLAGYSGIFALFRGDGLTISLPPDHADFLRPLLPVPPISTSSLAAAFPGHSSAVIGPAYIGYADSVVTPLPPARSLTPSDSAEVSELQSTCDVTEWDHGGSTLSAGPASGVFVDGQLVSLAGYEAWGGCIAHISVITHPAFRRQGFGRSAVAHLASRALVSGLIPQYRTLYSNLASIRVAEALGFCHFATSMAIRLRGL